MAVKKEELIPQHKDFFGQFKIATGPLAPPEGFRSHEVGTARIAADLNIPVVPLLSAGGETIGYFLGTLIDYQAGCVVRDAVRLPEAEDSRTASTVLESSVEEAIYQFAGSFLCVVSTGNINRIYLDASGTKSLIFDPETKTAASSTGLILDDGEYVARFRQDLFDHLDVNGVGWFPSFLTAHEGVRRLLCNHYLDLDTWRIVRHWPLDGLVPVPDFSLAVDQICSVVERNLATVANDGSTVSALTAGNETRFLLAMSRNIIDKVNFMTVRRSTATLDAIRAGELAERFGLAHRYCDIAYATEEEARLWQYNSSHCIGGGNKYTHKSVQPLSGNAYFVGGLGGEVARAFLWRPNDNADLRVDAGQIVPRFGMPASRTVFEATEEWLEQLPDIDPFIKLDLAYLELRLSAWAFAQAYSGAVSMSRVQPMISRETYALMLALPPQAKRGNAMIIEGIKQRWPELLELPINRYGDYRDRLQFIRRVLMRPKAVIKKLRKLYG